MVVSEFLHMQQLDREISQVGKNVRQTELEVLLTPSSFKNFKSYVPKFDNAESTVP